jgi:exonuclease SbcC
MFNLKSVRLEGFRGFAKNGVVFEFSAPAVLLYGDNYQGKSSVLNAVEWCLYGDGCIGTKSNIRERVGGWEVVNRQTSAATVEVVAETDEGLVTVTRTEEKGKGKRGKHIQVTIADGTVLRGDDAEREITRMLPLSFGDFATAVHQHQETIRAVLIQRPKERNEAIDRLLGLGEYRNVLEGIRGAKLGQIQKQLATEREKFEGRVEQALAVRRSDVEEKTDAAMGAGLDRDELSAKGALGLATAIVKDLQAFASELGVAATPPVLPSRWHEMGSFVVVAEKELDRLWSQAPDIREQSRLNERRGEAEQTRLQYDRTRKGFAQASSDLRAFQTEHGNRDTIEKGISEVQRQIDDGKQQIREISPRADLVKEGIALLREVGDARVAELCPLCGKRVPNLLKHLEKEWAEKLEAQVRALNVAVEKLRVEKRELERLAVDHDDLERLLSEARTELAKSTQMAARFLDRRLTKEDDPFVLLSKEIEKADERLEEIESALTEKRAKLGATSGSIRQAGLVLEILELEDKIRRIEKIADTEEYKLLEYVRDKVAQLVTDVEVLSRLVAQSLAEEASSRVSTAGIAIDNYFRKISQNPGVERLHVEIQEDARSGGNSYSFRDQDGQELSPVLSQGDLNCLALSVFLGMVTAYSHPVGFVLMDDPSQSLGTDQKHRLVQVIEEVCETGRRVVLATMDAELQEFLRSSLGKAKTIYQIHSWTPESGPSVSLEA